MRLAAILSLETALACFWACASAPCMLVNGAMEGPYSGGLPQGWTANCYGSNRVVFSEEACAAHQGSSSIRVTCERFASGAAQFYSSGVSVEKGRPYTLSLWLKGDLKRPARICLRQRAAPYAQYLSRAVRVRPEWAPVLIAGEATGTDPDCCVFVCFEERGTLVVDDVRLTPGLCEFDADERGSPEKGNRVYNSGFEAGPEGWAPARSFTLDRAEPATGRACARVGAPGVECRPFRVRAGRRYTLSARLRAAGQARVTLRAFEWADDGGDQPDASRPGFGGSVTVSNGWGRYSVSGVALPSQWDHFVVRLTPSGEVWVDDVQVEEGGLTDYAAARTLEIGAETPARGCLVGERVTVTGRVSRADAEVRALRFTLEDLWARPVSETVVKADEKGVACASFVPRAPGLHRVRVSADEPSSSGEVWFGVFPARDRRPRPSSPFGTHVTMSVPDASPTLRLSEAMGARWVRLHDFGDFCHWRVVEPEKGRYVWRDAEVDALLSRGFSVLANLGHPPLWAGRAEPAGGRHGDWTDAPPRDPAEWAGYVFKTVEHFKGRIRRWEVWNEPCWRSFFSGTPEEYTELLKIAYREIKRADPEAIVIGGCFSAHAEAWTRDVLAEGALEAMDALSYHVYWSPPLTAAEAGGLPEVGAQVARFAALMGEKGASRPIYMTEGGVRCPPFASWLPQEGFSRGAAFGSAACAEDLLTSADAASALVRGMTEMLSAGVVNICYYYSGGAEGAMPWFSTMANGYYVMTDYDGRPKATMMAYSAMELMLDGARPVRTIRKAGWVAHLFTAADAEVAVVWCEPGRRPDIPWRVKAYDLMGKLTRHIELRAGEPAYLRAPRGFRGWETIFE